MLNMNVNFPLNVLKMSKARSPKSSHTQHCVTPGKKKKEKKPLPSLLFVLPFASYALIPAGMSPVVESSGSEEQNSRWNWTPWGLVPPHSYSSSFYCTVQADLLLHKSLNVPENRFFVEFAKINWTIKKKNQKSKHINFSSIISKQSVILRRLFLLFLL